MTTTTLILLVLVGFLLICNWLTLSVLWKRTLVLLHISSQPHLSGSTLARMASRGLEPFPLMSVRYEWPAARPASTEPAAPPEREPR